MNIIEEVTNQLVNDGKDYSGNMVIFPGRRPAHFVRKLLAERLKSSFIPPLIYSMDDFIDYIYYEISGRQNKPIETLDAITFLYNIHTELESSFRGVDFQNTGFHTFEDFIPIAIEIFRELEEICMTGQSRKLISDTLKNSAIPHVQSLGEFYERFYDAIENDGCSSRAVRYRLAAEISAEIDLSPFKRVIFAGSFSLTGTERKIFKEHSKKENVVTIDHKPENETLPEIQFHKCPDRHGEVFALTSLIHEKMRNGAKFSDESVIVLPSSDTLFPLYHQTVPLFGNEGYNISTGYPAKRTPVYGFISALLTLLSSGENDRYSAKDYVRFLLHPYTKNILYKQRADITRIIMHTVEEYLASNRKFSTISLEDIENDFELRQLIFKKIADTAVDLNMDGIALHIRNIHYNTVRKLEKVENTGDFSKKCREILEFIYNNSTAYRHPLFHRFSERFLKAFDDITNSLTGTMQFTDISGYYKFFKYYIGEIQVPFPGTPLQGVQILGSLETRNLKFDHVFYLDANDDIISNAKRDESFLPFNIRRSLGIPTYKEREALLHTHFQELIYGAKEVHFFYIEKDKKEKSRFLEKILWEIEKDEKKPFKDSVQYRVNLVNTPPTPIRKTDGMNDFLRNYRYSAASIDSYLQCPIRFYYRHLLKLKPQDEVAGDIERTEIGIIVHNILRNYFQNKINTELSPGLLSDAEMKDVVETEIAEYYGENLTGAAYLLKRQIEKRMTDFLESYQIPAVANQTIRILAVERVIKTAKQGFNLTGRLDRIEKRGDSTYILDYKTSGRNQYLNINFHRIDLEDRSSWQPAIGTLQLPFYLYLYMEESGEPLKNIKPSFLLLGEEKLSKECEHGLFDGKDSSEANFRKIKKIIFELLKEITDPSVDFRPPDDLKRACTRCEFKSVCGTKWVG